MTLSKKQLWDALTKAPVKPGMCWSCVRSNHLTRTPEQESICDICNDPYERQDKWEWNGKYHWEDIV